MYLITVVNRYSYHTILKLQLWLIILLYSGRYCCLNRQSCRNTVSCIFMKIEQFFLAAMSSSSSDNVTQSVRPSVRSSVRPSVRVLLLVCVLNSPVDQVF